MNNAIRQHEEREPLFSTLSSADTVRKTDVVPDDKRARITGCMNAATLHVYRIGKKSCLWNEDE